MKLSEMSWVEICSIFADLGGCNLALNALPHEGKMIWKADFQWQNEDDNRFPIGMRISTGYGYSAKSESSEKACMKLLKLSLEDDARLKFPGSNNWKVPKVIFNSKEELELKLDIVGIDLEFSLTHRGW